MAPSRGRPIVVSLVFAIFSASIVQIVSPSSSFFFSVVTFFRTSFGRLLAAQAHQLNVRRLDGDVAAALDVVKGGAEPQLDAGWHGLERGNQPLERIGAHGDAVLLSEAELFEIRVVEKRAREAL